jgi:excisionase family DNA binding protein
MDDEVLTPSEAAVFLKTGEQRVLRLARKGEIPSFRLGKRDVRFYASDLRRIRRANAEAEASAS